MKFKTLTDLILASKTFEELKIKIQEEKTKEAKA